MDDAIQPMPLSTKRFIYNRDRINKILEVIAEIHLPDRRFLNKNGLLDGKIGLALFYFHYYEYTQNEKYFEIGGKLLFEVLKDLKNSTGHNPYLSNGLCGILWCIHQLHEREYFSDPIADIFGSRIFDQLEKTATNAVALGNIDYLHGAMGILAFLNSNKIDITTILLSVLQKHEQYRIGKPNRITPSTSLLYKENLTLAHGEAGILAVLLQVYKRTTDKSIIKNMIQRVSLSLLKKINKNREAISLFPDFITERFQQVEHENSQLAWCTGELSICYVLLDALEILKEYNLITIITNHLNNLSRNFDNRVSQNDMFFCHGNIGYSYQFSKLYLKTKAPNFFFASEYWLNIVCEYFEGNPSGSVANRSGFPTTLRLGVLNGSAGVGLSLISMVSGMSDVNCWDEMLLL